MVFRGKRLAYLRGSGMSFYTDPGGSLRLFIHVERLAHGSLERHALGAVAVVHIHSRHPTGCFLRPQDFTATEATEYSWPGTRN